MARALTAVLLGLLVVLALPPAAGTPAYAVEPACAPAHLDGSALVGGLVTVSPAPGSRDAPGRTQISLLGAPAPQLRVLSVVGSRSGAHRGRLLAYSQGDGASFVPERPFVEGEQVTVRARVMRGAKAVGVSFGFAIARHDPITSTPEATEPVGSAAVQSFVSRPDLRPPAVSVTAQSAAVASGDLFLAPYAGPGQSGPMILDGAGNLVWFNPLPANVSATNLQVQQYLGQPVLTWWQGDISVHGFGLGEDVIANSSYSEIAHVSAGNGYESDLHDFQLTSQGTALVTAYDTQRCNLSSLGGPADGAVTDGVLQEIDVATGLVRFQWTSLDHVPLSDSYELARKSSLEWPFDFFHINSIDRTPDGHLLVSGRNTWTVYELDPRSGQIVWRLGGKHTNFKLARGAATAWQHDSRLLANGSISIFDNGAAPQVHAHSRGVVISINEHLKTASLVGELARPAPLVAESQGNMQALGNGDWFVGWGQIADFSEFNSAGQLLFDAHLPAHVQSYRDFRFQWQGAPAQPPEFALQAPSGGTLTAYASWNGATAVSAWRVLEGPSPGSLAPVAQSPRSGFETAIALPAQSQGPYVTVQALSASGEVLGTAAPQTFAG